MNKEQSSKVAEAELDLNNALVNADISNGYEEYLALFDHFYDENVEVASDSNPAPLVGKARVLPDHFQLPDAAPCHGRNRQALRPPSIYSTLQRQA